MTNYVIEGTVSEISIDEEYFKLKGCEGYAIMQNAKKYNLLCPESLPEKEKVEFGFILSQDYKFPLNEPNASLLMQSFSNVKKIKIVFKGKLDNEKKDVDLNVLKENLEEQRNDKAYVVIAIG
ncbi:MAG: hypothetical protein IK094_05380 [Treponema sp.]|nr:hypothetical protein [Treponema sp.]